jgi:hypothetical protein
LSLINRLRVPAKGFHDMDIMAGISGVFALATIIATLGYLAYAADGPGADARPTIGDADAG